MVQGGAQYRLVRGYFFGGGTAIVVVVAVVVDGSATVFIAPCGAEISMLMMTDLTAIGSLDTWRIWPPCT